MFVWGEKVIEKVTSWMFHLFNFQSENRNISNKFLMTLQTSILLSMLILMFLFLLPRIRLRVKKEKYKFWEKCTCVTFVFLTLLSLLMY